MTPISIVAYLALFVTASSGFLFVHLLIGRFLRPAAPNEEKLAIYECGEPTIGSSFVQFDIRYYVVALLFIIFGVEVAFFFPWATVFGKATHLMDPAIHSSEPERGPELRAAVRDLHRELGIPANDPIVTSAPKAIITNARRLALMSFADIVVFFAVLLVGFAYVWKRGDLDWVRALGRQPALEPRPPPEEERKQEPVLTA